MDAFTSMRARGMRGLRHLRRDATSVGHLQVLGLLQLDGPCRVSSVARALGVSAAAATGMVQRMEERGLVARGHDEGDRRVVLVRMTEDGRAMLDEVAGRGRASLARILRRLGEDELTQLRDGLRAFNRAARAASEEEPGGSGGPRGPRHPSGPREPSGSRGPGGGRAASWHGPRVAGPPRGDDRLHTPTRQRRERADAAEAPE